MNTHSLAKASALLFTFLILLVQVPASAVDQVASAGGEKGNMELIAHQKVNINTADTAGLTTLTGVGTQLAKRITEFRKQNGPFQKAEDIMQVKGIGIKVFDQNKDRIVLK
jgi:competence protein ComEA